MKCPDCSGAGKIQLLTSAKPCAACGGTGTGAEPPRSGDGVVNAYAVDTATPVIRELLKAFKGTADSSGLTEPWTTS